MSAATHAVEHGHGAHHAHDAHDDHGAAGHGHGDQYATAWRYNRMGLWLFFLSEVFLFGGLLSTRFYLWGNHRPETDQVVGLIVTVVLLISSYSMNMAETAMEHGDRRTFLNGLVLTAVLGMIFFFGVLVFEWGLFPSIYEGHLTPWGDQYGAVVFAMTGMHAIHVLSGVIFIAIVWNLGRKGHFSAERHWGVEACAIYWHFVDLVWIFFYPAIYLIGTVAEH
jgi:cytochrome c oxidase subunit III